MQIIKDNISLDELEKLAQAIFGNFVKGVVDINRGFMVVGGELHADEEAVLLADGSKQEDLWGINIYPEISGDERIEFDSMINLRPSRGNLSRGINDSKIQAKILKVTNKLIKG